MAEDRGSYLQNEGRGRSMRTLDEVIADLRDATEHLSAMMISKETWEYALRYLQSYRAGKIEWELTRESNEARYLEAVKNCERAENKFIARLKELEIGMLNNPLTWDELKQMEGKPVWVESYDSFNRRRWMFVGEWFDEDEMRLFDMGSDYPDYISKNGYESGRWQAYRKERS